MRTSAPAATRIRAARALMVTTLVTSGIVFAAVTTARPAIATAAGATSAYRPLTPCRLLDTREAGRAKPVAGETLVLAVRGHCGVATDATAVAITVTVTEAVEPGFVTAWPSGQAKPDTSTVNYALAETRANGALLSLGGDGTLSLFTLRSTHVIVDVSGQFHPAGAAAGGRYVPLTPMRALDTRDGGGGALAPGGTVTVALPANVPADATALAVLLTVTEAPGAAFLTAYPAGSVRPPTSSLNSDGPFQTRTATQIVPVSPSGLSVFTNAGGHIIVDVVGYFTGASATTSGLGLFVPATPSRVLDTRLAARVQPGGAVLAATAAVTGANATAVAANITVTESGPAGFTTAWAAQTAKPATPAVSYDVRHQTVANLGLVSVSANGVAVASTSGAQVVVDVTGWFTGSPLAMTTGPPLNDPPAKPQPTGPTGCLQYVPVPSSDGVYLITLGSYQTVAHIFEAGPKGPIVVIGDSLTSGSAAQTARALRTNGWGPICVDGTTARSIEFGTSAIPDGLDAAARIRASNPLWDDPAITWVVALGTNDVGFSAGNAARSDAYVADQIAAIGVNPISWVNVRTGRSAWQFKELMFNQSVIASGVAVIDWYSASAGQPWLAGDQVHLNAAGYDARAELVGRSVAG